MFYAFLIFIAIPFFILGYYLGKLTQPKVNSKKKRVDSKTLKLIKEYENFLNYDGSQQP